MNAFRGGILRLTGDVDSDLEFIPDGVIVVDDNSGEILVADGVDKIRDQVRTGALEVAGLEFGEDETVIYNSQELKSSMKIAHSPYGNCHCHMCQPPGVDGELLEDAQDEEGNEIKVGWLPTTLATENWAKQDPERARVMARGKFLSYLENGITASIEYTTSSIEVAKVVLDEAKKLGLAERVLVGYVAMDQNVNSFGKGFDLEEKCEDVIDDLEELVKENPGSVCIIDRFPIAVSSAFRRELAGLAQKYDVLYETHMDESQNEIGFTAELYDGRSIIQVLKDDGVLAPGAKVGLAHVIHTTAEDMHLIEQQVADGCEVYIRMCPNSNAQLDSPWYLDDSGEERYRQMPLAAWKAAGAKITMGLDKGAGRGTNMAAEALEERGRRHANWYSKDGVETQLTEAMKREPDYEDLYRYATVNGLESINCEGGLRKGEKANFVVTDSRSGELGFRDSMEELTIGEICGEILESGRGAEKISEVWVEGKQVKVDGRMNF